jgi:hypothetical protein
LMVEEIDEKPDAALVIREDGREREIVMI